jgi:cytochrome P450
VATDWDTIDFFMDESLVEDPYPYFEHLRGICPVARLPHHGVVAVTGYDEATDVYRDVDTFSSCNSVIGPFATFPVPLEGADVSEIIDRFRDQLPMHEHMVTMDPPMHTQERALLMRLITPKRLKETKSSCGASPIGNSASSSPTGRASSSARTPSRSPCS